MHQVLKYDDQPRTNKKKLASIKCLYDDDQPNNIFNTPKKKKKTKQNKQIMRILETLR